MGDGTRLEIIVSATDNASRIVSGIAGNLRGAFQGIGQITAPITGFLDDFRKSMAGIREISGLVQGAFDETVGKTVAYADQVRQLQRMIGATAEDASSLIQAGDDVNVSFGEIAVAMQQAIRKGFKPTMEGLGELADRYVALPPGIERTQFAMETFGRSGQRLAPLLAQGSAGIKALGEDAKKLGLVLSQDAVNGARRFEMEMDNLNDRMEGMKIRGGTTLLPWVNAWLMGFDTMTQTGNLALSATVAIDDLTNSQKKNADAVAEVTEAHEKLVTVVRPEEIRGRRAQEALRAERLEYGALGKELEGAARSIDFYSQKSELAETHTKNMAYDAANAADKMDTLREAMSGALTNELASYGEKQTDLTTKAKDLSDQIADLEAKQGRVITTTQKATVTQAEYDNAVFDSETASLRLADAQKKLSDNTDADKTRDLYGAVLDATVAYQNAGERVTDYGTKLGGTTTAVVNNSAKIRELKGDLAELNLAMGEAARQHEATTKRIIFDMYAQAIQEENLKQGIKGYTDEQAGYLDQMAQNWGLVNQVSYQAANDIKDDVKAMAEDDSWYLLDGQAETTRRGVMGISNAGADARVQVRGLQDDMAGKPLQVRAEQAKSDLDYVQARIEYLDSVAARGMTLDIWAQIRESITPAFYGGSEFYAQRTGARQTGGTVGAYQPVTVGEGGAELFIPNAPGRVLSHGDAMAAASAAMGNAPSADAIGAAVAAYLAPLFEQMAARPVYLDADGAARALAKRAQVRR